MPTNGPVQTDLFRLDWLPLEEAARLCGLAEQWFADELLAGHMRGISTRVSREDSTQLGILVWMPSVGLWVQSHRDLHVSSMGLLRDGATSAGRSTGAKSR